MAAQPKLVFGIFTEQCYGKYFVDFNFLDAVCFKASLSKALSFVILLGSLIIKVPQIIKILPGKQKPGESSGLAPSMYILEAIGYSLVVAHHYFNQYALTTYGENLSILVQNMVILFLLALNQKRLSSFVGFAVVFGAFLAALFSGQVPLETLALGQNASVFIFSASRFPQIYQNWKNQSTGKLAFATVFLSWAGGCARVFTTMQELKGDTSVLFSYGVGVLLNGTLLFQIFLYWNNSNNNSNSKSKSEKKKKNQ